MEWIDSPLSVERLLTEARINEVITNIDKNTIIYTEYVEWNSREISKSSELMGYKLELLSSGKKYSYKKHRFRLHLVPSRSEMMDFKQFVIG